MIMNVWPSKMILWSFTQYWLKVVIKCQHLIEEVGISHLWRWCKHYIQAWIKSYPDVTNNSTKQWNQWLKLLQDTWQIILFLLFYDVHSFVSFQILVFSFFINWKNLTRLDCRDFIVQHCEKWTIYEFVWRACYF